MTDTRTRSDCKHCGQPIYRLAATPPGVWFGNDGWLSCRTPYRAHEPVPVEFSGYDYDEDERDEQFASAFVEDLFDDERSGPEYDTAAGDEGR